RRPRAGLLRGAGGGGDDARGRRSDADGDGAADRRVNGVVGEYGPGAGRLERHAKGVYAAVGRGKDVVGGQQGLRVAAGEVNIPEVAGIGAAVGVSRGDREAGGSAGRDRRGKATQAQIRARYQPPQLHAVHTIVGREEQRAVQAHQRLGDEV